MAKSIAQDKYGITVGTPVIISRDAPAEFRGWNGKLSWKSLGTSIADDCWVDFDVDGKTKSHLFESKYVFVDEDDNSGLIEWLRV